MIEFEPGKVVESEVCVKPAGTQEIQLTVEEGLKEYTDLNHTFINTTKGDCVPYTITLPQEFETPGMQKGGITATEAPSGPGGMIDTRVRITHQIWVDVPFPGRYLESSLNAQNTEAGEFVELTPTFTNRGNKTVTDANGRIDITHEDEVIDTVQLSVDDLESQEEQSLTAWWNSSGYEVGRYRANMIVQYANRTTEASDAFKLGTEEIRLLNTTPVVTKDGIVPYLVRVESFWSDGIDVQATGEIERETGGPVTFETKRVTVAAWETNKIRGYLDTGKLETGTYDISVELNYANTTETYEREVRVEEQSSETGANLYLYSTVILAVLVLILAGYALQRD